MKNQDEEPKQGPSPLRADPSIHAGFFFLLFMTSLWHAWLCLLAEWEAGVQGRARVWSRVWDYFIERSARMNT